MVRSARQHLCQAVKMIWYKGSTKEHCLAERLTEISHCCCCFMKDLLLVCVQAISLLAANQSVITECQLRKR